MSGFVICSKPGQLGNRLVLFSQFIAFAIEHGVSIVNLSFDEYAKYFRTTSEDALCRFPKRVSYFGNSKVIRRCLYWLAYCLARVMDRGLRLPGVKIISLDWSEGCDLDSPEVIELVKKNKIVLAQGWGFRSKGIFYKHSQAVRKHFALKESHGACVERKIRELRNCCDVLIGAHIRQGDYRTFFDGKFYYETEFYVGLMNRVATFFPGKKVMFMVCSNQTQDPGLFSSVDYQWGPGNPVEDMYALAECDYILGPPSTFTMWASFYGRKPLYMIADPDKGPTLADFIPITDL